VVVLSTTVPPVRGLLEHYSAHGKPALRAYRCKPH